MTFVASVRMVALLIVLGEFGFVGPLEAAQEKLPSEFAEYPLLANAMQFGNYTLERFTTDSPAELQHSINKNSNQVIIKKTTDIDKSTQQDTYYKLDIDGNIIDQYSFYRSTYTAIDTGSEVLVGGAFLVNLEKMYYTTWPLDGKKSHKYFTPINEDLQWPKGKVDAAYSDIAKKAARIDDSTVWEPISARENKQRYRKVFYLNDTGNWYVLYGDSLKPDYTGKHISPYSSLFASEDPYAPHTPPRNITIPYFEKLNSRTSRSHGGGSTNSGPSTTYIQEGMGYYQLRVGNSLLQFKVPEELSVSEGGTYYGIGVGIKYPPKESLLNNFDYYTNPRLNYSLFSAHGTLYLIKKT
ncbi:hypothetical protein [Pseudomonas nicosulfuronedens]